MAQTTKLEAVNSMLGFIGESPVSTISGTLGADTTLAVNILDQVTKEVQEEGWTFNTDLRYEITLDGSSKLPVPADSLRIDLSSCEYFNGNLIERGGFIYDRYNHTDVFTTALRFDIIREYAFEEVPQVARTYMHIKAARRFTAQAMGSPNEVGYTFNEEAKARADLLRADGANGDHNMLSGKDFSRLRSRVPR